MPNRQNQHIDSPIFKEYVFRILKRTTPMQRKLLSDKEQSLFNTESVLRKFCNEERMDYLMYILSKVGIDWTFRIHEDAFDADMLEYNSVEQYEYPAKQVDVTQKTAEKRVIIISSRDVMARSHMLAQNCNTYVYSISEHTKDIEAKGHKVAGLRSWESEVVQASETHALFNKILMEQLNALDWAETNLDLDANDIRILSILFSKKDTAVRMTQIADLAKSSGKKMYFRDQLQKLLDKGYISTDEKEVKKLWANSTFFFITTSGINALLTYTKYVHEQAFGYKL